MEVTNIFHLQVPPNEADALVGNNGMVSRSVSGVESAKEFLINLLMVFSQRIDVARHSNERWGALGRPERNNSCAGERLARGPNARG